MLELLDTLTKFVVSVKPMAMIGAALVLAFIYAVFDVINALRKSVDKGYRSSLGVLAFALLANAVFVLIVIAMHRDREFTSTQEAASFIHELSEGDEQVALCTANAVAVPIPEGGRKMNRPVVESIYRVCAENIRRESLVDAVRLKMQEPQK